MEEVLFLYFTKSCMFESDTGGKLYVEFCLP